MVTTYNIKINNKYITMLKYVAFPNFLIFQCHSKNIKNLGK